MTTHLTIPAKIRRMSKRRQKIVVQRRLRKALAQFVGQPITQALAEQIAEVTAATVPWLVFTPDPRPIDFELIPAKP